MRRVLRATVALVALTGLLGTTAVGAALEAHVALEHDAPAHSAHTYRSDAAAAEKHGHEHEPKASIRGHDHAPAPGEVHRSQGPGHRHATALVADVQARPARTTVDPVAGGTADAPATLAPTVPRPPLGPTSRAGPVARSAPLSRRSVVLQV